MDDGFILSIGVQIAEALSVIHGLGYVYRDLKPQNVMLEGGISRVKLIDFGTLYRRFDNSPLVFESEGYTPREFLEAEKGFLPSGDIYSLGAVDTYYDYPQVYNRYVRVAQDMRALPHP